MDATKRPWKYDDVWALITGPKGEEICALHSAQAGDRNRVRREVAWDNARLIVTACNSFDKMLSLLQSIFEKGVVTDEHKKVWSSLREVCR